MEPENYPGPAGVALGHGTSRILQVASSVVTAAQVLVYLSRGYVNARRESGRAVALAMVAQQRAEHTAAGVSLAAIRDPRWLESAAPAWTAPSRRGPP